MRLDVVEKIKGLWPKSSDAEVQLLMKYFKDVSDDKAIDILEDAKGSTRYQTIPFPYIKDRATGGSYGLSGSYIDCVAVHWQTAKFKLCAILAQSNEGAKVQMEKYLKKCRVEPTDYTLFIGNDDQTRLEISDYRLKILGMK